MPPMKFTYLAMSILVIASFKMGLPAGVSYAICFLVSVVLTLRLVINLFEVKI